jgi:glycosyltransferase involved in cell wall biosynthesis
MNVLIFSQYFWPESFRINDIARDLIERGHRVTILTSTPNYPDGVVFPAYRAQPERFSQFEGAEVIRIPQFPRGKGRLGLLANYASFVVSGGLFGAWKLRNRPFDCIFMFETSPITSALPALLQRRLKRAPLLMWVLDLWPETLSAVGVVQSPRLLRLVGHLVRFIYGHCDRILVQSRAFFEPVRRYAGSIDKVRYFPQWAETGIAEMMPSAQPAPEIVARRASFNIVFAGNIGEAQDFPTILKAADMLRSDTELRWFIVGDGRAAAAVRAEISQLGLADNVHMVGRHPLERMPEFFRAADALLVSLRDEPIFALTIAGKIQSYMAAGVPIVAMLNGEGRRVISEAGCGVTCAAGDAAGLAAAVTRLKAMSSTERARMGTAGQAYCAEQFDRRALLDSLDAWLSEAAAEHRRRQPQR